MQSFSIQEHRTKRHKAYGNIKNFWHDLDATEYALYDICLMTKQEVEKIKQATERIGRVFFKTAHLLRNSPDETLKQLDIPDKMLPYIRHRSLPVESVISRVDLVQTSKGLKLLEINSDTPTFEKEVFHVNEVMCHEFGVENPNKGSQAFLGKEIRKALAESIYRAKLSSNPHIVFTSHHSHEEDRLTSLFLMEAANVVGTYVPLHKLQIIKEQGLFDDKGCKIDVLYRQTYPIEHLINDYDEQANENVGIQLLELVRTNRLQIINPISAFLLQSKAVQAVIWGMFERDHPFFTQEEKRWIGTYFLPTYLDNHPFLISGVKYVKKPSFGREGDTVSIYKGNGKIMEPIHNTYQESLPVYQEFVELPKKEIKTTSGIKTCNLLIGSFLINGQAGGIGLRAGQQITDNNAYFLPIGIKSKGGK